MTRGQGKRITAGPADLTFQSLARHTHFSVGALSGAMAGRECPRWEPVCAIVAACGGEVHDLWPVGRKAWLADGRKLDGIPVPEGHAVAQSAFRSVSYMRRGLLVAAACAAAVFIGFSSMAKKVDERPGSLPTPQPRGVWSATVTRQPGS
ncbi:hypothetical protein AB0I10_35945 [Streptomyces sp. NPDC050636]|uniref:hypothetical protein n=1 Tax=Streptomyces sp. NPDC050636 TaxID=3154510 RepID=UPI003445C720